MILYGSGNADGNRHSHHDLPILLAGNGCGTLKSGRHIRYPKETPLNNLWLSMLNRMDVDLAKLGDSTGQFARSFLKNLRLDAYCERKLGVSLLVEYVVIFEVV